MGQWLAWIPGNGTSIRVGLDLVVKGLKGFALSSKHVQYLHDKGYHSLYQVAKDSSNGCIGTKWLDSVDLGL